jgi:hypothetical protein
VGMMRVAHAVRTAGAVSVRPRVCCASHCCRRCPGCRRQSRQPRGRCRSETHI